MSFIDDVPVTGPVAAAKNRTARNLSIAKSKVEIEPLLEMNDVVVIPPRKNVKSKMIAKKSQTKRTANKRRIVAKVTFPSSTSKGAPTFKLPDAHKIYSKNYTFPYKLFDLLDNAENEGYDDIISFNEQGDQFVIHDHQQFATDILPQYFGHAKLRSFDRQLSYWGFKRCNDVRNCEFGGVAWMHPLMQKGQRSLVKSLKRVPDKNRKSNAAAAVHIRRVLAAAGKTMPMNLAPPNPSDDDAEELAAASTRRSKRKSLAKSSAKSRTKKAAKKYKPRTVSPFVDGEITAENVPVPQVTAVARRVSDVWAESMMLESDDGSFDESAVDAFLPLVPIECFEKELFGEHNIASQIAHADGCSSNNSGEDTFEGQRFHLVDDELDELDGSDVAALLYMEHASQDDPMDLHGSESDGIITFVVDDGPKTHMHEFHCTKEVFNSFLNEDMNLPTNGAEHAIPSEQSHGPKGHFVQLGDNVDAWDSLTVTEV
jgi:HSF-type DNA-binding